MTFNLDHYEDVNARITRFRQEYPMGRLEAHIQHIDLEGGRILVKALAFRTDDPNELPAAIDYAYEFRQQHGVNRDFWVENCVTSAYGRVIGALSPSNARPTRQDMEKAKALDAVADHYKPANVKTSAEAIAELKEVLGARVMSEPPRCKHGMRLKKAGTAKTGKPYLGWACSERNKSSQCEIIWWRQTPDGKDWVSPEDFQSLQHDHLADATAERQPKEPPPYELMSPSERRSLENQS
jgi:hypothetical protein